MVRYYKPRAGYRNRSRAIRSRAQRGARSSMVSRRRFSRRRRRPAPFGLFRNPLAALKVRTVLNYQTSISLNPTANVLNATGTNVYQFSSNGLFDPDITGTGHQPMYFDNYSAVYKRYRVVKSAITVTVVNHFVNTATTVATVPNYSYRLFILNDGTPGASNEYAPDMTSQLEEGGPNLKWRFVAPSLTGRLPKLKHKVVPSRLCNLTPLDDSLEAPINALPAQSTYFYVGITSADGNTDPPAVYLYVQIRYWCEFFDREQFQNPQ